MHRIQRRNPVPWNLLAYCPQQWDDHRALDHRRRRQYCDFCGAPPRLPRLQSKLVSIRPMFGVSVAYLRRRLPETPRGQLVQNERRRVSLQVDYGNEDVTDMAESKRESLGSYASCLVLNASQNNNRSIEVSLEQNKMGPPPVLPVRDDQFFCGRESFFHGLPAEHL